MTVGYEPSEPTPPPAAIPPQATSLRVPQAQPLWTYVILGANVLAFLLTWSTGPNYVLSLGAKANYEIVSGEWWRLVTSMFLHVGLLHIGFNSYALWIFGPQVERPYGHFRFLVIYFLSGLAGSGLSFLLSPNDSVGASGAIFGLIGVVGAYLYRYRKELVAGRTRLTNILSIIGYNLVYGIVVPRVDNWGHIGGLIAGLVLGWFMAPRYEISRTNLLSPPSLVERNDVNQWIIGIVLVGLGIGATLVGGFWRWTL